MASSAVKPRFELYKYPPKFIPSTIVFDFFTSAIKDGVIRNISNSLFIGGITVIIVLFCSSLAGYAFARIKSKWGFAILLMFLITQMLPQIVVATPLYLFSIKLTFLINIYQLF